MTISSPVSELPARVRADLDGHHPVSPEQLHRFKTNGYVKLKHVLRPDTVEFFGREIATHVRRFDALHLPMGRRMTGETAPRPAMNLWRESEVVREFSLAPKLARLAAELLEVGGVRLYHDRVSFKEPGGGIAPWHADQHDWPVSGDRTVTGWIPLQTTPPEMGPLAFVPGSHRIATDPDSAIGDDREAVGPRSPGDAPADIDETAFDLGEVSFHLGRTLHRAGLNRSARPRRAMTMIYFDEETRLIEPTTAAQENERRAWCPGVDVGDVLASPLNPVLWSARA